jgi:hypothetical protein
LSGVECGAGGANVIRLRKREDETVGLDVQDGGLADRETVGIADVGAEGEAGFIGVFRLAEASFGTTNVSLGHADFGGVFEREIDNRVEG